MKSPITKFVTSIFFLLFNGLIASSQCGFELTVNISPEVEGNIYCSYDTVKFSTVEPYDAYQWYYNFSNSNEDGTAIMGATEQVLEISAGEFGFAYFYVEVTRDDCTEASEPIIMDTWVFLFPVIIHEPAPVYCHGDSAMVAIGPGAWDSYQWYRNGEPVAGGADSIFWVTETGTYVVNASPALCPELVLSSGVGPTFTFEGPEAPEIMQDGDQLVASSGPEYQWFIDGEPIAGATEQAYEPGETGNYTVQVSDGSNCTPVSAPFFYMVTTTREPFASQVSIGPNPVADILHIRQLTEGVTSLLLLDASGRQLEQRMVDGGTELQVDVSRLRPGVYFCRFLKDGVAFYRRFIKK